MATPTDEKFWIAVAFQTLAPGLYHYWSGWFAWEVFCGCVRSGDPVTVIHPHHGKVSYHPDSGISIRNYNED